MILLASKARIRFGFIHPVHSGIIKGFAIAQRHIDEKTPVRSTCFKQQNLITATLGELIGQHATCGPCPHNNEIEIAFHGVMWPYVSDFGKTYQDAK